MKENIELNRRADGSIKIERAVLQIYNNLAGQRTPDGAIFTKIAIREAIKGELDQ